jgi:hypothetical protein
LPKLFPNSGRTRMNIGVFQYADDQKFDGVSKREVVKRATYLAVIFFRGQVGCDAWIVLPVTQVALLHSSANTCGHDGERMP